MRQVFIGILTLCVTIVMLSLTSYAHALEIECYNDKGKVDYKAHTDKVWYSEGVILFLDIKTDLRMFANADCIVTDSTKKARHPKKK